MMYRKMGPEELEKVIENVKKVGLEREALERALKADLALEKKIMQEMTDDPL